MRFTSFGAWITFWLLWKYRKRMEENVATALGDEIVNPADRKALIWKAWKNFARGVLETCAVLHLPKETIVSTIAIEGEEHLKQALARGKGGSCLECSSRRLYDDWRSDGGGGLSL